MVDAPFVERKSLIFTIINVRLAFRFPVFFHINPSIPHLLR